MKTRAKRIERYYDTHEVEGEELSQSIGHMLAIRDLVASLEWYFYAQQVAILDSVNLYQTHDPREIPKCPDIAIIDGLDIAQVSEEEATSYYIGEDGPPPRLAFEISSRNTWRVDLFDKPAQYAELGIKEYFAFDPNLRSLWTKQWRAKERLVGWRLGEDGQYSEIAKDEQGRLWSEELQSWLVVEGEYLRLYTREGQRRLTGQKAEAERADLAQQQREAAERLARAAERRAEAERQQREAAELKAEAAERRAQQLAERLAELLRQHGQDPDKLL